MCNIPKNQISFVLSLELYGLCKYYFSFWTLYSLDSNVFGKFLNDIFDGFCIEKK